MAHESAVCLAPGETDRKDRRSVRDDEQTSRLSLFPKSAFGGGRAREGGLRCVTRCEREKKKKEKTRRANHSSSWRKATREG